VAIATEILLAKSEIYSPMASVATFSANTESLFHVGIEIEVKLLKSIYTLKKHYFLSPCCNKYFSVIPLWI